MNRLAGIGVRVALVLLLRSGGAEAAAALLPQAEGEGALPVATEIASLRGPERAAALGEPFEIELAAPAALGGTLRLAGSFVLDPALKLEQVASLAADRDAGAARLRLRLRACAPGGFELGPWTVALSQPEQAERWFASETLAVEVAAPWSGDPPPPFTEWRLAPAPTAPSATGRGIGRWLAALAALLAGAWWASRRRNMPAAEVVTAAASDRALLAAPWPAELAARRARCFALHAWLRGELARRAPATAFAWVRAELLEEPLAATFAGSDGARWATVLAELEHAMYSSRGAERVGADLAARLAALLPERAP